jgi:DNA-binding transcriptional LysR family regulator
MNMNLRDLQYFAVVAKHRHLGRAAESLGLSQPALSMSLRRLEQFMQTKLVKRTAKGVDLTTSGEAVYAHARRLRLSVEEISREVADLSDGRAGHLRIGTGSGSAFHVVPAACAALLNEAPKVTLEMTTGERSGLLTSLGNGELDVVLSTIQMSPNENLSEESLYDQPFVVFASASNQLTKRKQVTLADLAQQRWALTPAGNFAQRRLRQLFERSGLPPPSIALETANLTTITHLVAASGLLGFTSRQSVRYAAARIPIAEVRVKDLSVTRRIGVICRKDAYLSPAARRFIEILKMTAKKITSEIS